MTEFGAIPVAPIYCSRLSELLVQVGERAAAFYSLTGTVKLCGLDPEAYLREVFTRIGEHPINRVSHATLMTEDRNVETRKDVDRHAQPGDGECVGPLQGLRSSMPAWARLHSLVSERRRSLLDRCREGQV